MQLLDFQGNPLWLNLAIFAVAAGVVWFAGTKISGYANAISKHTGIGKAVVGLILLGGITSLPEVAVTVTAALNGNAPLAVNNMLGGSAPASSARCSSPSRPPSPRSARCSPR